MFKVVAASFVASALALAPPSSSQQQQQKAVDRRSVGAGLLSALGVASVGVQTASAASGESPKFSFFGILGNSGTYSEGAAYGIDQEASTYSPYSPFTAREGKSVYKTYNSDEVAFNKKMFTESTKRVAKVDKYIEAKKWEEVRAELQRQVYNMRGTMNYLATGKPDAEKAAKDFYLAMEAVDLYSKKKQQAPAAEAYKGMMAALDSYSKLI